ncbi:hypothetical protein AAFF_G00299610 [Aldrovandia affinis]|uniref:Uncharacterized protein n=1 Tax=Aldrovandia affinis TaxID=143900 RepID=A0AAD7W0D9_9TELE|nr:hypothetical protein AAFF_G00299610 [Aldrovandia affinis]
MQTVGLIHTLEQCLNRMQTVGLIHTLEQCLNRMQTVGLIHTLEQCLNRMQTVGLTHTLEQCLNRMQTVGLTHTLEQLYEFLYNEMKVGLRISPVDRGAAICAMLVGFHLAQVASSQAGRESRPKTLSQLSKYIAIFTPFLFFM